MRMRVCATLAVGLMALTSLAHADGGASLNVCNFSKKHSLDIAIAWFAEGGNGFVIDKYPFHSKGWFKIKPDTCEWMFEDWPLTSRYWFRVESEGRLIRDVSSGSRVPNFTSSTSRFCADPQDGFLRNYQSFDNTAASCSDAVPLASFPMAFYFDSRGSYLMNIDPDAAVAKQKTEPIVPVTRPAMALGREKINTLGFECCFNHFPERLGEALVKAKVLLCDYGPTPYSPDKVSTSTRYWYKAPPPELQQWLAEDERGEIAALGLKAIDKCPANSNDALKLQKDIRRDYERAVAGRR